MKNKIKIAVVLVTLCLLFYIHDHPDEAKQHALNTAQSVSSDVSTAIKENATESKIQEFVELVVEHGQKFNKAAQQIVQNILSELGYGEESN